MATGQGKNLLGHNRLCLLRGVFACCFNYEAIVRVGPATPEVVALESPSEVNMV